MRSARASTVRFIHPTPASRARHLVELQGRDAVCARLKPAQRAVQRLLLPQAHLPHKRGLETFQGFGFQGVNASPCGYVQAGRIVSARM